MKGTNKTGRIGWFIKNQKWVFEAPAIAETSNRVPFLGGKNIIFENLLCFKIYLYSAQTCFLLSLFSFLIPMAKNPETEKREVRL